MQQQQLGVIMGLLFRSSSTDGSSLKTAVSGRLAIDSVAWNGFQLDVIDQSQTMFSAHRESERECAEEDKPVSLHIHLLPPFHRNDAQPAELQHSVRTKGWLSEVNQKYIEYVNMTLKQCYLLE